MTENCRHCNAEIPASAVFCPTCGRKLQLKKMGDFLTPKRLFASLICGVLLFVLAWYMKDFLAGDYPQIVFDPKTHGQSVQAKSDPELERLRAAIRTSPDDNAPKKALVNALFKRIPAGGTKDSALLLEIVDLLSTLVAQNPDDAESTLQLADISFEQRAFDKAATLYGRYLELKPDEELAKARLASTLAFLGRFDESRELLQQILENNPEHFQAKAFLAISYAQEGDQETARQLGEEALEVAPDNEARRRFEQFLAGLDEESLSPAEKAEKQDAQHPIAEFVKTNPVAGQKFESAKVEGDVLVLTC